MVVHKASSKETIGWEGTLLCCTYLNTTLKNTLHCYDSYERFTCAATLPPRAIMSRSPIVPIVSLEKARSAAGYEISEEDRGAQD